MSDDTKTFCMMYDTIDGSDAGITLTHNYKTLDDAREAGMKWQADNGDNPCWNAFEADETQPLFTLFHGEEKTFKTLGYFYRVIGRFKDSSKVHNVYIIGPFTTREKMIESANNEQNVTKNHEWQSITCIENPISIKTINVGVSVI